MSNYIARRLLWFVPTVFFIALTGFIIMHLPPGDYVTRYIRGEAARGNTSVAGQEEQLREQFGLNKPVTLQFIDWVVNMARGDFGNSFSYRKPVSEIVGGRLGATLIVSL